MNIEETQTNSSHLAEDLHSLRVIHEKKPNFQNDHTSTLTPLQECRDYIPSVFRGINTTGSYHVYGDLHVPAGQLEGSHKVGDLPKGGKSQKQCSQVLGTNMAHSQATSTNSPPVPRHPSYPTPILQSVGAHRSLQKPGTPMENDSIHHPQTSCLSGLSPGLIKGVICSPQSPLRSDCQPNSPTESNSSRNATLSLKRPSDCPKDAKARNWKKYKLIVLNQSDENDKEAQGGSTECTALSLTQSPCRDSATGGHSRIQTEDGASEHRDEMLTSQSMDSCSSSTCSSIR